MENLSQISTSKISQGHSNLAVDQLQNKNEDHLNEKISYTDGCGPSKQPRKKKEKAPANTNCLPSNADTYRLNTFSENIMIIHNQINDLGNRESALKDVEALKTCFGPLGFEIQCHNYCTAQEIFSSMKIVKQTNMSEYGCIIVVVLAYCESYGELKTKEGDLSEKKLMDSMIGSGLPNMVTKPKILVIQAFGKHDSAVDAIDEGIGSDCIKDEKYEIANESDVLLIHSGYPGQVGPRQSSRLIKTLCHYITNSGPEDTVNSIASQVIGHILDTYKDTEEQIPFTRGTLTRLLRLKEGHRHETTVGTSSVGTASNSNEEETKTAKENEAKPEPLDYPSNSRMDSAYAEYIIEILADLIRNQCIDNAALETAKCLQNLAGTKDKDQVLSKADREIGWQIVAFLEKQNFEGKEKIFFILR